MFLTKTVRLILRITILYWIFHYNLCVFDSLGPTAIIICSNINFCYYKVCKTMFSEIRMFFPYEMSWDVFSSYVDFHVLSHYF